MQTLKECNLLKLNMKKEKEEKKIKYKKMSMFFKIQFKKTAKLLS